MVKIGRLTDEITKQLRNYSTVLTEEVNQITDELTNQAVQDLKNNVRKVGFVDTGSYLTGWTRKKTPKGYIIHNKTDYQLTHLLERGHAKAGGGRVVGKAHIRPVAEMIEVEFERRIEEAAKR